MLVLVIGDYGVGKDTIVDMLVDTIGKDVAAKIKSWTTRDPRDSTENTHKFVWWLKTIEERNKYFERYILGSDLLIAYTKIDGCYYWVEDNQLNQKDYEFCIVDKKGAADFKLSYHKDLTMTIEIKRPEEQINVNKKRLERKSCYIEPDIRPLITFYNNSNDLNFLKTKVEKLADIITGLNDIINEVFYEVSKDLFFE